MRSWLMFSNSLRTFLIMPMSWTEVTWLVITMIPNFFIIDEVGQSVWISFFKMPIDKVNMEASTASNDICIYFAYKDNNLLP